MCRVADEKKKKCGSAGKDVVTFSETSVRKSRLEFFNTFHCLRNNELAGKITEKQVKN